MAELDHINDIDNGVVYDLKDKTARQTITENELYLRNLFCVSTGNVGSAEQVPGYGRYNVVDITLSPIVGYFDVSAMDGAFLRIIFRDSSLYDYSLPILIKAFESDYSREVYCYVYTNTDKTEKLKITGTETIDFIYDKVQHCFFVVGRSSTGDLSNYYTKSQTDNLLNAKANAADLATVATSGNYNDLSNLPTIPAAQVPSDWNATAGVARILNKPNLSAVATSGNYSDLNGAPTLAPVATSGDYDDLTDKPDLSELQYLANVAAADDFNPGTSYSYLDFVKYNDHLYICISSSGSTAGPFDPTEWNEIIIGEQAAETTRTNLLANQNKNRLNNLATVATSGDYSDLNGTPTIPAAQVNSDWNATGTVAEILNKPNLSAVATSGNYSDLQGAPTLAAVATSGLYADLAGTPTLAPVATSGDYDDLTDKPTFKTINGTSVLGSGDITTPDTKPTNHTNAGSGNVSVSNNTWTTLWDITIPKGEWIIQVAVAWQTAGGTSDNGTGFRTIELNDNSVNPGNAGFINTNAVQATTGTRTTQQMTCPVAPSTTTTYTVYGRHNAGTGLQALPRIRYVKIG